MGVFVLSHMILDPYSNEMKIEHPVCKKVMESWCFNPYSNGMTIE